MLQLILTLILVAVLSLLIFRSITFKYDPIFFSIITLVVSFIGVYAGNRYLDYIHVVEFSHERSTLEIWRKTLAYLAPIFTLIGAMTSIFWETKSEIIDPTTNIKTVHYNWKAKLSVIGLIIGLMLSITTIWLDQEIDDYKDSEEKMARANISAARNQIDSVRGITDSLHQQAFDMIDRLNSSLGLGQDNLGKTSELLRRFQNQRYPLYPGSVSITYSFKVARTYFEKQCPDWRSAAISTFRTNAGETAHRLNVKSLAFLKDTTRRLLLGTAFNLTFQKQVDSLDYEMNGDRQMYTNLDNNVAGSDSLMNLSVILRQGEAQVNVSRVYTGFRFINDKRLDYINSIDLLNSTLWLKVYNTMEYISLVYLQCGWNLDRNQRTIYFSLLIHQFCSGGCSLFL